MSSKAKISTATTSAIFELLNEAGIPTVFKERLSDKEFLAKKCKMILLECIARRHAVGSFTKRFPNFIVAVCRVYLLYISNDKKKWKRNCFDSSFR